MMRNYQIALSVIPASHGACLLLICSLFEPISDTRVRLLDIDDFIENLWKIHVQVKSEGYVQVQVSYNTCIGAES